MTITTPGKGKKTQLQNSRESFSSVHSFMGDRNQSFIFVTCTVNGTKLRHFKTSTKNELFCSANKFEEQYLKACGCPVLAILMTN